MHEILMAASIATNQLMFAAGSPLDDGSWKAPAAFLTLLASVWCAGVLSGKKIQGFTAILKTHGIALETIQHTMDRLKIDTDERLTRQDRRMEATDGKIDALSRQREIDRQVRRNEIYDLRRDLAAAGVLSNATAVNLKILLVDDCQNDRILFRDALGKGFVVDECENLDEAVQKAAGNTYDAIILDLYLPDSLPGKTVSAFMGDNPDSVCLAISGTASREHENDAIRGGADSYIPKLPRYKPGYLSGMIRLAIQRKMMQQ